MVAPYAHAEGALARSRGPTFAQVDPEVGQTFALSGRRWTITDHSSYDNPEGYHVDEWECAAVGGKTETAFLLRESDAEIRWYFTRPIPISAVSLSGGKPFAEVASTLIEPPDTLVYRGLAHGLDETTDGTYADDPGESVQKTTWDYWDAKQELNLAVERWADGRVECFHGRRTDPGTMHVEGGQIAGGMAAGRRTKGGPADVAMAALRASSVSTGTGAAAVSFMIVGFVLFIPTIMFAGTVETALTVALGGAGFVAFLVVVWSLKLWAWMWLVAGVLVAAIFYRWPPLTSGAGVAALLLVPAGLTLGIAGASKEKGTNPAGAAGFAIAIATLAAGLFNYYWFAPVPRSIGQYFLAVGPAPLTGLVAIVVAWGALKIVPRREVSA